MNAATERIVYDESTRLLSSQDGLLNGLRTRAGTLLAAASLVTAFLAPAALEVRDSHTSVVTRHFDSVAWAATASFVSVVVAALVVLWPYEWVFGHSSHELMDNLLDTEEPADEAKLVRHLAYYNDVNHSENQKKIGRLFFVFELGCLALTAEIGLWLGALAT